MAHRLARDLHVSLALFPVERGRIAQELREDDEARGCGARDACGTVDDAPTVDAGGEIDDLLDMGGRRGVAVGVGVLAVVAIGQFVILEKRIHYR